MERLNPVGELPYKIHLACLSDPRHQLRDMFGRRFGENAVSEIENEAPICKSCKIASMAASSSAPAATNVSGSRFPCKTTSGPHAADTRTGRHVYQAPAHRSEFVQHKLKRALRAAWKPYRRRKPLGPQSGNYGLHGLYAPALKFIPLQAGRPAFKKLHHISAGRNLRGQIITVTSTSMSIIS